MQVLGGVSQNKAFIPITKKSIPDISASSCGCQTSRCPYSAKRDLVSATCFLTRLGLKSGSASDDNILQIDDIDLRLSQGESANIHYLSRKVVLMDWHHDFEQAEALVLSHNELCETNDLAKVEAYFAQFGMSVMWIKDHPALLTLRTIALLINEACEASLHGVASLEDIDNAMKYGVNYPKGPYQWLTQMGGAYVLQTLNNLYALYGEEKYRASIYLKQYVAKTQNIATQYSRDMTEFA